LRLDAGYRVLSSSPDEENEMTPQETELLQDFLSQLVAAGGVPKDRDAEAMIQRAGREQADALYLLVQRSLIQQQALEVAQRRIAELERAANAKATAGAPSSFLGGDSWGRSNRSLSSDRDRSVPAAGLRGNATPASAPGAVAGVGPAGGGAAAAGPSRWAGSGSRAGGFLGQAAAMAAGVAGGAFLFQGIGSLLGQHGSGSGLLNPGGPAPTGESMTTSDYTEEHRGGEAGGEAPVNAPDGGDPALRDAGHDDQRGNYGSADAGLGDPGGDPGGDVLDGDFGGDFGGDDGMI
jgi:hypothetical protein